MYCDKLLNDVTEIVIVNGVVLIMECLPYYSNAAVSLFLKKGSRDETENEAGYAHFMEHMLFKGTNNDSKVSLSEKFDKLGGQINAYTSKEEVVLYNIVPSIYLNESLLLMLDMFNNALIQNSEIELEREVILNELNMTLEDPQDKLLEDFFSNFFNNSGLAKPILGNEKSIKEVTSDKLIKFYEDFFTGDSLIISVVGNFNKQNIIDIVNSYKFRKSEVRSEKPYSITSEEFGFTKMSSELVHIINGNLTAFEKPESYFHISLLNIIFGDSMSSRLFQRVRDNMGLCYTINSDIDYFRKEVLFTTYFSVMPSKLSTTVSVVSEEIEKLKQYGITADELEKAKKQKTCQFILSNDQLVKRMNSNIYFHLYYDNKINKNDALSIIENTQASDLNNLIEMIFKGEKYTHLLYKQKPKDKLWKI